MIWEGTSSLCGFGLLNDSFSKVDRDEAWVFCSGFRTYGLNPYYCIVFAAEVYIFEWDAASGFDSFRDILSPLKHVFSFLVLVLVDV